MPRTIVSATDVAKRLPRTAEFGVSKNEALDSRTALTEGPEPPKVPDDYKTRLLKYIPGEVVALYIFLEGIVKSAADVPHAIYWVIFCVGALGTYLYLLRVAKVEKQVQLIISVVAFCVWAFALGGPFAQLAWYKPVYGALLLPIYTFFVPMIEA